MTSTTVVIKTIFQKGVEVGSLNACFNLSIVEDYEEGFAWNKKSYNLDKRTNK